MKKKLLFKTIITLIFCVFTNINYAQTVGDKFKLDDIEYLITAVGSPNEVGVYDYLGASTTVNIPNSITNIDVNYNVTSVVRSAFANNNLTNVTIPNSVTSIGSGAFSSNSLASVTIPNSVTSIGASAFTENSLTSVIIPSSVTSIEFGAFSENSLTSVTIPNSITSIGSSAFSENSLTSVTIPSSVTSIGNHAFSHNDLTSVTIPNSITSIGSGAFSNNSLTSITIPNSVITIGWSAFFNNSLTSVIANSETPVILTTPVFNNKSIINLTVPEGFKDAYLAAGWIGFGEDLIIVNSVEYSITSTTEPFTASVTGYDKTNIETEIIISNKISNNNIDYIVTNIENSVFSGSSLTNITIPDSVTSIGSGAFSNNNLTNVTIPNSVISIGSGAFSDNSLTSVTISESVNIIENGAFQNNALINLTIPNSVEEIQSGAFSNNNLTSVNLSNSVTNIDNEAFLFNSLTSITLPESITRIGLSAFQENPNLTTVTLEGSNPPELEYPLSDGYYEPSHFGDHSIVNLIIPIGSSKAYKFWPRFKSVTQATLNGETLKDNRFTIDGIEYLVNFVGSPSEVEIISYVGTNDSVIIPTIVSGYHNNLHNVTSIGDYAFFNNIFSDNNDNFNLTSVTIPNSIKTIGEYTFAFNSLTEVTLPDSVTSIGASAFSYNNLTEVTLPNSSIEINNWAFTNNSDLTKLISKSETPASLTYNNIFDDRSLIDLTIPDGTTTAYENADWTGFKSVTEDEHLSKIILDNLFNKEISVFPNPVNTNLTITLNNSNEIKNITVYNSVGNEIIKQTSNIVSFNNLSTGIYFIKIENKQGKVALKKIVKK